MHITAEMFEAVARGEMSEDELLDAMIEHLAELCPGCAEAVTAHEARLAHGEDPKISRETLEWDLFVHMSMAEEHPGADSPCDHGHDFGPS